MNCIEYALRHMLPSASTQYLLTSIKRFLARALIVPTCSDETGQPNRDQSYGCYVLKSAAVKVMVTGRTQMGVGGSLFLT